jgi:hypothetical protein
MARTCHVEATLCIAANTHKETIQSHIIMDLVSTIVPEDDVHYMNMYAKVSTERVQ